jgi:hypothetical protein
MNRTAWMTLVAAGLAGAWAMRTLAAARNARRVAAARVPDRHVVEQPEAHREELDTYQALLDESLQLTFPASDPVCAHAAMRCSDPCVTPADPSDWRLHPGSLAETESSRHA